MNLEQAMAISNMKKQQVALLAGGQHTKTAKEMAEMVFELSAAAGEPYQNALPGVWARRWLASKKFTLVDIDPRQVAVPFINKISRNKVLAMMQASADSLPPIVVDMNHCHIGKTDTGYVPPIIVVDGKNRHRTQMLCGRDRITAWVGERALAILQARASARKPVVIAGMQTSTRILSKIEVQAAWGQPSGGSPVSVARQDTGDAGSRPTGSSHAPVRNVAGEGFGIHAPEPSVRVGSGGWGKGGGGVHSPVKTPARQVERAFKGAGGASAGAGPGGGVSGLNPARNGFAAGREKYDTSGNPSYREFAGDDPSDRGQLLDPSDKNQFSLGEAKDGDPNIQSPGSGVGPRIKPSMKAGPIKIKRLVTHKKKSEGKKR